MEDRKTLRDRVARLESLLETALHGKQEGDAMNFQEDGPDAAAESAKSAETDESEDGLDDEATSVPYMSALNDSMVSQTGQWLASLMKVGQSRCRRESSTESRAFCETHDFLKITPGPWEHKPSANRYYPSFHGKRGI